VFCRSFLVAATLGVVVAGSLVSVMPAEASSSSSSDFIVGAVEPLSGTLAAVGTDNLHGVEAEAAIINKAGGILGHHVKVVSVDDASNPEQEIAAVRSLTSEYHLNALMGDPVNASSILPYVASILMVSTCSVPACESGKQYPDEFSVNVPGSEQVGPVLQYAKEQDHATKVGVLVESTTEGQSYGTEVDAQAKALGLDVVDTETFPLTATDVTPELQKLKSAGAQVVDAWASGEAPVVMSGMQAIGWNAKVVGTPALFTAANLDQLVPTAVAGQLKCVCYRDQARTATTPPQALIPLISSAKSIGINSISSSTVFALGGDQLALVRYGYETAKSMSTSAAAKAISGMKSAKSVPLDWFYTWRGVNPAYTATDHFPGANLDKGFWAIVSVSPVVDGASLGSPINF
jgi:branched-chain amino acid transport system substrate-binding protein